MEKKIILYLVAILSTMLTGEVFWLQQKRKTQHFIKKKRPVKQAATIYCY